MPGLPAPLAVVATALLVLLAGCGAGDDGGGTADGGAEPLRPLTHGDPLPEATLPRLDADGSWRTADLRGRPAVVNFWATWCPYCIDEMPDLEQVHRALGDRVRFVGVDREDPDREAARRLAAETGVTYPLVVDDDGSFFRSVRGRGMPTTLFVDADGVVRHRHAGPLEAEELRALIAEHLAVER